MRNFKLSENIESWGLTYQDFPTTRICMGCNEDLPYESFHYTKNRSFTIRAGDKCTACLKTIKQQRRILKDKLQSDYICAVYKLHLAGLTWRTEINAMEHWRLYHLYDNPGLSASYFNRNGITAPTPDQKSGAHYLTMTEMIEEELWEAAMYGKRKIRF